MLMVVDVVATLPAEDDPAVDIAVDDDTPPVCLGLNAIVVLDFLLVEGLDHPPFSINCPPSCVFALASSGKSLYNPLILCESREARREMMIGIDQKREHKIRNNDRLLRRLARTKCQ